MITVTLKWANKILKTILEPAPGGGISSLILLKLEGKFKNNNIIIDKQSTLFLLLPLFVKSGVIL